MHLLQQFISNYQSKNLFTPKDKLLIAVSGGVDSVVLCKLSQLAVLDFAIAHCNFQLRGADSDRDENFVKEFTQQLNVPFYTIRFDTKNFAVENKCSTQEAARELRYAWFEKIRTQNNYDYILTAHHADDNIETVVMSFFRGTGIKGLTGIREKNGKIIRPLLFARRKDLESFLQEQKLSFVQDETNGHNDYTRNYFRNTILPLIAKVYPEANENVLANIERMKGVAMLYNQAIEQHRKKIIEKRGEDFYLPVLLLQQVKPQKTVIYEIVQEYGFSAAQLKDVLQLLQSESGKYVLSATHRILRNRNHLIISPIKEVPTSHVIIENEGKYVFTNGKINIKKVSEENISITENAYIALLDASMIEFPLILRPWKTGDYFYPLGMQKKKKLSRFFIDKKLSLLQKEKVWIIEMNKKILWIVGHRIDNRFKVTPSTETVLQIQFKQS